VSDGATGRVGDGASGGAGERESGSETPPSAHRPVADSPTRPVSDPVEARKAEHLQVTATRDVSTRTGAGWADIHLIHEALPEIDLDAVDLGCEFLGRGLSAPLAISAMTGGHAMARELNAVLARAAERHGLAMGVGSQRAALQNPRLSYTYAVVREEAPSTFLIANLGAPQLVDQGSGHALGLQEAQAAIAMIAADALAVHLNFLEESIQPEGDRRAAGCAVAIKALSAGVGVPIIAKETGAGVSRTTALRLRDLGVAALDVGGVGGTSFAAIEGLRAAAQGDERGRQLGELLRDWGVPTAVAVIGATAADVPIVATGGIRSGLDAAKALAVGATLVGVARPLLQAAMEGDHAVDAWIEQFLHELRTVLFLTGSRTIAELQAKPRVMLGDTRAWLEQLGYAS
jgi:isopentenyl-diphosphate delta-isomerase